MKLNRKAQMGLLLKVILFVVVLAIVVSAIYGLLKTNKKTAMSIVNTELSKFESDYGSLVNPSMPLKYQNFWHQQFIRTLQAAVSSQDAGGSCTGMFYSSPEIVEGLLEWRIILKQEGADIKIQFSSSKNEIAATYPADDNKNFLQGKKLCMLYLDSDGHEVAENVDQVSITFGKKSSYYSTGSSNKADFSYEPIHIDTDYFLSLLATPEMSKSEIDLLLFFFKTGKIAGEDNRFCIYKMSSENENSYGEFGQQYFKQAMAKASQTNYDWFCKSPFYEKERNACYYQGCHYYTTKDGCNKFSTDCGKNLCRVSDGRSWFIGQEYYCMPCPEECGSVNTFSNRNYIKNDCLYINQGCAGKLKCMYDAENNKCIAEVK